MLAELRAGMSVEEIMNRMDSGMPKLWVLYQIAASATGKTGMVRQGSRLHSPLPVEGPKQAHLIAFLRGESVAVLAPRWNVKLGSGFGRTTVELPRGHWTNIFTGETVNGGKYARTESFAAISGCAAGARWRSSDASNLEVWAPFARHVSVESGGVAYAMRGPDDRGWWQLDC